jgi:hypothetical protein
MDQKTFVLIAGVIFRDRRAGAPAENPHGMANCNRQLDGADVAELDCSSHCPRLELLRIKPCPAELMLSLIRGKDFVYWLDQARIVVRRARAVNALRHWPFLQHVLASRLH